MKIVDKVGDEIKINIFPRQHDFLASEEDDVFFGGAAGPGKSTALLLYCVRRRMAFPGSKGLILRRTFRELENSLILSSHKIFPIFGGVYNEQKKRWTLPNGSIQQFGYCETDADVFQYQSAEYDDVCFDELTHFSQFQFTYITTRCRTVIPNCKAQIRSASNPGNIGHVWVKKRYIDPAKVSKIWTDLGTKKTMSFIPARISDNLALMESDPGYMQRLKDLPEQKYLALAEGSWEVSEGQFFEAWNEKRHVLRHRRIPDSYTMKFLSLDWGFAAPGCVLWWEVMPSGRVFIYRELYFTQLHPKELGQKIIEMSPENERYEYMCASPDIWGKKSDMKDGGEPIAEGIQTGLGVRINMIKAMNARVEGWLKMKEWLTTAPDGQPWLQVSPNCENLIRTIPGAIYETRPGRNNEDMDERGEDHALESCLLGDTDVITSDGKKRIDELVGKSGFIWTISGWEQFTDVRKTRENVPVFKLTLSDGRFIVATGDHEIATPAGWICLDKLTPGNLVSCIGEPSWMWKSLLALCKFLMERGFIIAEDIFREKEEGCTVTSGNFTTVQFQAATISTTLTETDSTTQFRISKFSRIRNMLSIMQTILPWSKSSIERKIFWIKPFLLQENGTCLQKDKNGTEKTIRNTEDCHGKASHFVNLLASLAELFLNRGLAAILDFAISIAKCVISVPRTRSICVNTIESVGSADVYNLEVDNVHCFSANGIVVHNCRYGAVSLMNVPRGSMSHPALTPYDSIFGQKDNENLPVAHLPETGRSGY